MASGEQIWSGVSLEQQTVFGHLHQDKSDQLPYVHPTNHLLKPAQKQNMQHVESDR